MNSRRLIHSLPKLSLIAMGLFYYRSADFGRLDSLNQHCFKSMKKQVFPLPEAARSANSAGRDGRGQTPVVAAHLRPSEEWRQRRIRCTGQQLGKRKRFDQLVVCTQRKTSTPLLARSVTKPDAVKPCNRWSPVFFSSSTMGIFIRAQNRYLRGRLCRAATPAGMALARHRYMAAQTFMTAACRLLSLMALLKSL